MDWSLCRPKTLPNNNYIVRRLNTNKTHSHASATGRRERRSRLLRHRE